MKYIYLTLIGLIGACSSSSFQQEEKQIDLLISQYDSLIQITKDIDVSTASPNLKRYREALAYSQTKLSIEKKPSLRIMTYLNDMKLMKGQFKNSPNKKKKLVTTLVRNQEQLNNLQNDSENSVFDKEALNAIISREKQAAEAIAIEVSEFKIAYQSYESRFDSLYQLHKTFNYE